MFFAHTSLDLPTRVRKPSKRQQGLNPVVPLTPAPAPKTKSHPQIPPKTPTTPLPPAPSSFVSHQIHKSQNRFNRTAARVLFTPHAIQHHAPQTPDSPTPYSSNEQPVSLSDNPSGSEVEAEIGTGLKRLNLAPSSSSSGSQSPRAGPHSKARIISSKPKGGAADVWKFFEKSESNRHICILCK
jgi:hypothetical protein